jgi:hypothetical protein
MTTVIQNSSFEDAATNGSGAIAMTVNENGATHDLTVADNEFRRLSTTLAAPVGIITANVAGNGGSLTGIISGNVIDDNNGTRRGIQVVGQPVPTGALIGSIDLTIDDNDIDRNLGNFAILTDIDDGIGASTLDITNNRVGLLPGALGQVGEPFDGGMLSRLRGDPASTALMTVSGNTFRVTTSAPASSRTVTLDVRDSRSAAIDFLGNTLRNDEAASGEELFGRTIVGTPSLCLNLNGNDVQDSAGASGSGEYVLTESAGTFTVEDLANVATNNQGSFTIGAGITSAGNCIP